MLDACDGFLADELGGGIHRQGDRFERTLQIGDRHPEFFAIFVAQCRGQFRGGQGGVGRQFHRCGVVRQPVMRFEKVIDPNRQVKGSAIEHVLLEVFRAIADDLGPSVAFSLLRFRE